MKVSIKKKSISSPTYLKKKENLKTKIKKSENKYNLKFSKTTINNLPLEILEKIIGNIHIWHRNRIRLACKTFKYASDSLLLHELKIRIEKLKKNIILTNELITLKAIHQGTWAFVKKGFGSIFLGKMLVLLRCHYDNPFAPTLENCKKFLKQFYRLTSEKFEKLSNHEARILFVLILLGYLHNINRCERLFSEYENCGHWQIIYILNGSWFDIYTLNHSLITSNLNYLKDGFDILIVLFCLMVASYKRESFKDMHEGNYKAYFIGYDPRFETKVKTFININIFSSKNMFNFLLSASKSEKFADFPQEEFELDVEFFCRQSSRKKSIIYRLDIGPRC